MLQSFSGHVNESYRCHSVLSPREDLVYSGDESGSLKVWDVMNGKEKRLDLMHEKSAKHHQKTILWTESSPKTLGDVVTAGADGFVKVWTASP